MRQGYPVQTTTLSRKALVCTEIALVPRPERGVGQCCSVRPVVGLDGRGWYGALFCCAARDQAIRFTSHCHIVNSWIGQMIGTTELAIALSALIVWGLLLWSAVARLQEKLSDAESPTFSTYVNELGGYVLVGIVLLVVAIAYGINRAFGW